MRYHKGKTVNRMPKIVLLSVIVVLASLFLMDLQIRPYIRKECEYKSKVIATDIITKSVYKELTTNNYTYDKLVILSKSADGSVTSVQNNMNEINILYSRLTGVINDDMDKIRTKNMIIPVGSLSGFNYFYGRGPGVKFELDPLGTVDAKLASKFTSAGVNQSLHEIILEVNSNIAAVLPGHTTVVAVKTNYILSSTIVVGKVPDSFTYITGDNRDDLSKVNDYKK